MAFTIKNISSITNNKNLIAGGGIPSRFQFWNEDGDTVTTEDYIPLGNGIRKGDQVIVVDADYGNSTDYNAVADGTTGLLTLTANA
jgi:hypothetical protein